MNLLKGFMRQRDSASLQDILNAARLIVQFRGLSNEKAFAEDLKTQSAVMHQLLIIGEATKRLSEEIRIQYPQIPWRFMSGMRDQLIHGYDGVDTHEVWQTVIRDIPQLIADLDPLIPPSH